MTLLRGGDHPLAAACPPPPPPEFAKKYWKQTETEVY